MTPQPPVAAQRAPPSPTRGEGDWGGSSPSQRDALELVWRRHHDAFLAGLLQLVAQRADRDAEDGRGVGAGGEAVRQRVDDEVALDVGDPAGDEADPAGDGLRLGLRLA